MNNVILQLSAEQAALELKRCFSIIERLYFMGSQVELVQEVKSILATVNNSLLSSAPPLAPPAADERGVGEASKES